MGEILSFQKRTKLQNKPKIDDGSHIRASQEVLSFFQKILEMMQDSETDSVNITLPDLVSLNGKIVDTKLLVVLMGVGDVVFNREVTEGDKV